MSFPSYPEYKNSGVEWLGDVPKHWSAGRFSRVILEIKDGTHGTFARVPMGSPLLSAKNVQDGYVQFSDEESLVTDVDHNSIVANGFPRKGDLLLTIVGTIGRACVYEFDYPLAFQRSVCFIRLHSQNHTKFGYLQSEVGSRSFSTSNPAECRGWNKPLLANLNATQVGWNLACGSYACSRLTRDVRGSWPSECNRPNPDLEQAKLDGGFISLSSYSPYDPKNL